MGAKTCMQITLEHLLGSRCPGKGNNPSQPTRSRQGGMGAVVLMARLRAPAAGASRVGSQGHRWLS